jgi:hypothetical protein
MLSINAAPPANDTDKLTNSFVGEADFVFKDINRSPRKLAIHDALIKASTSINPNKSYIEGDLEYRIISEDVVSDKYIVTLLVTEPSLESIDDFYNNLKSPIFSISVNSEECNLVLKKYMKVNDFFADYEGNQSGVYSLIGKDSEVTLLRQNKVISRFGCSILELNKNIIKEFNSIKNSNGFHRNIEILTQNKQNQLTIIKDLFVFLKQAGVTTQNINIMGNVASINVKAPYSNSFFKKSLKDWITGLENYNLTVHNNNTDYKLTDKAIKTPQYTLLLKTHNLPKEISTKLSRILNTSGDMSFIELEERVDDAVGILHSSLSERKIKSRLMELFNQKISIDINKSIMLSPSKNAKTDLSDYISRLINIVLDFFSGIKEFLLSALREA